MHLTAAVVAVTGAGAGIGRASALAFAAAGADVVVSDLDVTSASAVAGEIEALGRRALAVAADAGVQADVESLVDRAIQWQGHLDVMHNNAGIVVAGPPHEIPMSDWELSMRINFWSGVWATRRVLSHMLARGSGSIVFTSSGAALWGIPMMSPYVVSKWAMNGWAESLAAYCKPKGVNVSVVVPAAAIATSIVRNARVTYDVQNADDAQLRALGDKVWRQAGLAPEDLATVIVEGVLADRFYVSEEPAMFARAAEKWSDLDRWLQSSASAVAQGGFAADPMLSSPRTAAAIEQS